MSGMSTQFGKLLGHPVLRDPNEYAFTEIITFEFAQPVDLGNEATPVGQIWAKMIQTYSTQESAKMLWWGRQVEVPEVELPQVIKLIIDWKSSDNRKHFLASPEFTNLYEQWQSCPVPFQSSSPSLFALTPSANSRENAFALPTTIYIPRLGRSCISVFVTFHFSPTFDFSKIHYWETPARPKLKAWECAWASFRQSALKSDGGWISSGNADGWGVDEKSFIGVFRFLDVETAQKFFAEAQVDNPRFIPGLGGLQMLKKLADGEVTWDIEFVRMVCKMPADPVPSPGPLFPGLAGVSIFDTLRMYSERGTSGNAAAGSNDEASTSQQNT